MVLFLQLLFMAAAVVQLVLNVQTYTKWQESRREGATRPYPIKWFPFLLTTFLAIGCLVNVMIVLIRK